VGLSFVQVTQLSIDGVPLDVNLTRALIHARFEV
jgi:hypothetical protein